VLVPHWERGSTERLHIVTPEYASRTDNLGVLALGTSIATNGTLTAEAIVVRSFDELHQKSSQGLTSGKIIVFNQQCDWESYPIDCYGATAIYRVYGATEASRAGGVASLIRSLTPLSMDSIHTGYQEYQDGVKPIPSGCISVEVAELLERIQQRGQPIVLDLELQTYTFPDAPSMNVIAEVTGSEHPEQVIIVSGHIDSWDVGQGAMDDGGGAMIAWTALTYLRQLQIRPKRTIRAVLWTCEEFGSIGAAQYFNAHKADISLVDFIMESDMGVFRPTGLDFTGSNAALSIMQQIALRLSPLNATSIFPNEEGPDIGSWVLAGVPGASLATKNDRYFYFHHSRGDTPTVLQPQHLDIAAALFAVVSLSVANLPDMLPRNS